MLKVKNLTKKFGELEAVSNVSFEVKERECLGIIGPNGAGKTTLFNVISGFMKPTSGRVEFLGMNITGKKPHELVRLGLTRTFQIIRVFKNMTVLENFLAITEREEEFIKEMGLWGKRDYLAKDLPQGDLRRLNIGMGLATNPKMLLLDEPFSGLSPKEGAELGAVIKRLKEKGMTMIIIEHKLKELFDHVERVLVLNYGRLLCEGAPEEVVNDAKVVEAYLGVGYEGA
ncbi:MAG: ABC transporter ATP-binding protein [Candidatus Hecatellales archaeon]|nr:MAG: ABC transporter ATP-binding protein [Candidatus Hecatellales archaeon]